MNKHYVKTALGALLLSISTTLFAQNVAINISGNVAEQSAILDLSNSNVTGTLGFLPPYVSLGASATTFGLTGGAGAESVSSGMLVYNTSTNLSGPGLYEWYYNTTTPANSTWIYLGSGLSGSGTTNYTARWTTATNLGIGVIQDNATVAVISATAAAFGTTYMLTVNANATEVSAILGASTTTAGIGVTGGNSSATAGSAGVEGYIGTAAAPATTAVAVYGIANSTGNQIAVEGLATGAASGGTNIGAKFGATNATTNYALVVPSSAGNVGFGNIAPAGSSIVDFTNTNAPDGAGAPILWPVNTSTVTASIGTPVLGEEFYNSATGCFDFYNGTAWQNAGCPCNLAPTVPTITAGCTAPFAGEAVTYTTTPAVGVSYNWTATSNDGTPTLSGTGSQTVTVTWPTTATTGTLTSSVSNNCGSASKTFTTALIRDSITGPDSIYIGSTGTFYVVAASGYSWTLSGGGTLSATTTQSVTVTGTGAGTFTIQCVVTSSGGCTITLTEPVVFSTCGANFVVRQDENPNSAATTAWTFHNGRFGGYYSDANSMTISINNNNDMVLIAEMAYDGNDALPGTTNAPTYAGAAAGTASLVTTAFAGAGSYYAPIEIWWFPTTVAGTYTITLGNRQTNFSFNTEVGFAIALTGFCSSPLATDFLSNAESYENNQGYGTTNATTAFAVNTVAAIAANSGDYVFVAMNNYFGPNIADGPQQYQSSSNGTLSGPTEENNGNPDGPRITASIFGYPGLTGAYGLNGYFVEGQDAGYIDYSSIIGILIH